MATYPFTSLLDALPGNTTNTDKRPGFGLPWETRKEYTIKEILIHHAASSEDTTPAQLNDEHHARGWWKVSYHYAVDAQGGQWKLNRTTDVTFQCPGHNHSGLAICMIGDRNTREIPWDQYQSLIELVITILQRLPITVLKVFCHRTFYPTACPGKYFDLSRFQGDLAAAIGRAPA